MNERINSEVEREVNSGNVGGNNTDTLCISIVDITTTENNNGGDMSAVRPANQMVIGPSRDTSRMDSDTLVQQAEPQYAMAIILDEIPIAQIVNGPLNEDAGDGLRYDIVESAQIQDNDAEIPIAQIAVLAIDEENNGPWANPAIRIKSSNQEEIIC